MKNKETRDREVLNFCVIFKISVLSHKINIYSNMREKISAEALQNEAKSMRFLNKYFNLHYFIPSLEKLNS